MNYDALTMAAVADELRQKVVGGFVQKVMLPSEFSLGLGIYANREQHWLLISAHPQEARVHLTSDKLARAGEEVSPLLLLARKHIRDRKLVAVEQLPFERVLTLTIGDVRLVVEVMGRHSNIILVDGAGEVMDSVKRVTSLMSRQRTVLPHHPYSPPPPQDKVKPNALEARDLEAALATADPKSPMWQVLVGTVGAVSPTLAREVVFRATGSTGTAASAVKSGEAIVERVREVFSSLKTGEWHPSLGLDRSEIVAFAPYTLTQFSERREIDSIGEALETYYVQSERLSPLEQARRRSQAELAALRQPLQRKLESLERSMAQGEQAEELRRRGEMLLAFGSSMQPGQTTLVVDGMTIPVDPALTWLENAQACFKEYTRARGALEEVPPRLEQVKNEIGYIDQLETYVALARSVEELRRLDIERKQALAGESPAAKAVREKQAKKSSAKGRFDKRGQKAKGAAQPGDGIRPHSEAADGTEIYVGRSGLQNEALTFGFAGPEDSWLHARGVPGAHVIARCRIEDMSEQTLLTAAGLAAGFSQARESGKVEVDYTARKHVRKIKGAPPGMVTYTHERTVLVEPLKERESPTGSTAGGRHR